MSWLTFAYYILAYLLALWLGGFLLARAPGRPALRYGGLGLVVYAAALAGLLLGEVLPDSELSHQLLRVSRPLLFLPAILWAGALVHLLPDDAPHRELFVHGWRYSLPLLMVGFGWLAAVTGWIFAGNGAVRPTGYLVAGGVALLPILEALILSGVGFLRIRPKQPLGALLAALLLFSLSLSMLLTPGDWLPRAWLLAGIGLDLLLLGLAVAALDAFAEGEAWLPELLRSLVGAAFSFLLFAAPVLLSILLWTGPTAQMIALLLVVAATSILSQTHAPHVQAMLDALAYRPFPYLRHTQSQLRAEAQVQVRLPDVLDPATMDPEEFAHLVRRALSQFGNLPQLAASPLTRLLLVERQLQAEGRRGDTLERAAILKQLLAESIERLRPLQDDGEFHSRHEWRHFNALYYPYVVGLRPFSRRVFPDNLSRDGQAALDWFRTSVPERTLYNWQRAAADLIASDLRERAAAQVDEEIDNRQLAASGSNSGRVWRPYG